MQYARAGRKQSSKVRRHTRVSDQPVAACITNSIHCECRYTTRSGLYTAVVCAGRVSFHPKSQLHEGSIDTWPQSALFSSSGHLRAQHNHYTTQPVPGRESYEGEPAHMFALVQGPFAACASPAVARKLLYIALLEQARVLQVRWCKLYNSRQMQRGMLHTL